MPEESTTPDLVELTRRLMEAGSRRDVDEGLSFFTTDAVFDLSDLGFGVFEGAVAIRGFLEDWYRSYEEYERTLEEVVQFGEGVVMTVNTQLARLSGNSAHIRLDDIYILLFDGSKAVRLTVYRDIDEARAAAERLAEERE
jgi:ketosteroid isomerase-like protein